MMMEKYKISRWIFFYEKKGVLALWNSLNFNLVFFSSQIKGVLLSLKTIPTTKQDLLSVFKQTEINSLIKQGFLVREHLNEMIKLRRLRNKLKKEITIEILYLILTDGCNLKCRYCFEETPKTKNFRVSQMSTITAEKALDFFAEITQKYGDSQKKKIIHLYGGEPLLNPTALIGSINKIEQLKRSGKLPLDTLTVLITNGTLITPELVTFLGKNKVNVGLSIDGPKEITNKYRLPKNETINVFEKVKKAYNDLLVAGANVGLSITMTPEVVENFDEIIEFFLKDFSNLEGLSFNIMHYTPAFQVDQNYFNKAADCLIRGFSKLRDLEIHEERMMRKAHAFVFRDPMLADCGIIGNQIVISPDGKIGICQDFIKPRTYFRGNIFEKNFDLNKQNLFSGWDECSPFFHEICFSCPAIGICGGGCPASVELKYGDRNQIDERICPHSQKSLEWLIWDSYEQCYGLKN